MIHKIFKIYIVAILLLTDFIMFAQDDPGNLFEDDLGNIDDDIEDNMPINSKLIWLAIAGIAFMLYYIKKKQLEPKR